MHATALPRGHETILLVDDEEMVRRVISRMLRDLGYTVLEATDGREALEVFKARASEIDVLFTDVVLPGIQGRALTEQIKKESPAIRVLFTTGYSDDVILQHQLLESDVSVLHKPYTRAALAVKMREVLDRR